MDSLKEKLSYIDFAHIFCYFLTRNDGILAGSNETQQKKLINLRLESTPTQHDPEKSFLPTPLTFYLMQRSLYWPKV